MSFKKLTSFSLSNTVTIILAVIKLGFFRIKTNNRKKNGEKGAGEAERAAGGR